MVLEQEKFQKLSGITLTAAQATRYEDAEALAVSQLETMLGWPLDPESWSNQYIEIGKSRVECSCPDADTDVDDPDEVVGQTRLFRHKITDQFMLIDPATEIHAVKIVRNGYTCKTIDLDDLRYRKENGAVQFIRWLEIGNPCGCKNWLNLANLSLQCDCLEQNDDFYHIAVDADWAFATPDVSNAETTLPLELQKVLAELIAYEYDTRKGVKSESVLSHSYTKFDQQTVAQRYADVLKRYVGPHGSARRSRVA